MQKDTYLQSLKRAKTAGSHVTPTEEHLLALMHLNVINQTDGEHLPRL